MDQNSRCQVNDFLSQYILHLINCISLKSIIFGSSKQEVARQVSRKSGIVRGCVGEFLLMWAKDVKRNFATERFLISSNASVGVYQNGWFKMGYECVGRYTLRT